MKMINPDAIYCLWQREMIRFFRLKSRVIGSLGMPFFFLAFMGMGFRTGTPGIPADVDYLSFLTPGIIGMTLLFSSIFAGLSVLWDREFGFLREIMIAPVSRISIVLGRAAGGVTTAIMQSLIILVSAVAMGVKITGVKGFLFSVLLMILIAATFIGLGLAFASRMKDMSGFSLIMNFLIFPLFFLSGALFPIDILPGLIRNVAYLNPLTYGVDGLRYCLVGTNQIPLALDIAVLILSCGVMLGLGAYLFETSDID